MNSLAIGGLTFACIFGGALLGLFLRARLREEHLSVESKDVVKVGVGLVGTMAALVLGLLVASAKSSFDTQQNEVTQLAANTVLLDRTLAHYGPAAGPSREALRAGVENMLGQLWPGESNHTEAGQPSLRGEVLFDRIQALEPQTASQRTLQAEAIRTTMDLGRTRWMLFAQKGSSVSVPFLAVVVFWLTLIFASFGLFAPRNLLVLATLLLCTLSVAGALFLILELDRPFTGLVQISSEPLRNALQQLGR